MENLSMADFEQWANDPMTIKVRDYMLTQREEMNNVDGSGMLERAVHGNDMPSIEAMGLDSIMRASVIRGIDTFTDWDGLSVALFPSQEEVANV